MGPWAQPASFAQRPAPSLLRRRPRNQTKPALGGTPTTTLRPSDINQKVIAAAEMGDPLGLLAVVGQFIQQMNLVNLSTSIHRLAKLVDKDPEVNLAVTHSDLFDELLKKLHGKLIHSQGLACLHQTLSNVAWSLAHLYAGDVELLGLIASLSTRNIQGFKPFELSMLLWGFAKAGAADTVSEAVGALFRVAGTCIVGNVGSFSFRSLAMIVWAFATARQKEQRLLSGIAAEMRRTAHAANCQEIGNTVWAFASIGHRDRRLLAAMAQVATPRINDFKAQEISNMLWGFATLGFWNEEVFMRSLQVALTMELGSQHLAIILWSCAKIMPTHSAMDELVIRLAPLCTVRLGAFKPQEISSTLQALAKVMLPEEELAVPGPPLHEDVLVLLESLAQWVACNGHLLSPSSFATAVNFVILLGVRAERRLDLVVEQVMMRKAELFTPTERVSLLQAFLASPPPARAAVSVLAAGVLRCMDTLHSSDCQALGRACLASQGESLDGECPTPAELSMWLLAVAGGLPLSGLGLGPHEPDACPEAVCETEASSEVSYLEDDMPLGSEYRLPTAESLPFLVWRPADGGQ